MKKLLVFIVIVLVSIFFHSCDREKGYDESLLWGKWHCSEGCYRLSTNQEAMYEYWRYFSSNKGYTWVEDEDVNEDEAQPFDWRIVKSELRQIHTMEMGGVVPRNYTITELTATRLRYTDDFGRSSLFIKVAD